MIKLVLQIAHRLSTTAIFSIVALIDSASLPLTLIIISCGLIIDAIRIAASIRWPRRAVVLIESGQNPWCDPKLRKIYDRTFVVWLFSSISAQMLPAILILVNHTYLLDLYQRMGSPLDLIIADARPLAKLHAELAKAGYHDRAMVVPVVLSLSAMITPLIILGGLLFAADAFLFRVYTNGLRASHNLVHRF